MSHPLALSDEQRAHLAIAEADTARLNRLLCEVPTVGLTGHQWQVAACLASAAADQVQHVAELDLETSGGAAGADVSSSWATMARLLRESAARFELWSSLADLPSSPAIDGADEPVASDAAGVSGDAARDVA